MIAGDTLRVLLVQARLGWKQPEHNREHLEELLAATGERFDLAVLPETFTTGFLGDPNVASEGMDGPTVAWMRRLAADHGGALCGSAVMVENGRRYNRFLCAQPDGTVDHYDKRHLFSYAGENERYAAGQTRCVFALGDWRISPQVCYDLRFPVWCRNRGDFDLQLFVANWPESRVQHWTALLRARAIENQAFVIGVNRTGADGNGVEYPGCSQVYDPLGELVCDLGSEESCRLVTLNLARVRETRSTYPFQDDADPFELRLR